MWKEIIGIVATVFILCSMCFNTSSYKTTLLMRIFFFFFSVVFVVYGVLIPAISTAVLNFVLIVINTYHIAMLVIDKKNEEKVERKLKNVKDYLKINPSSDDEDKNIDVD